VESHQESPLNNAVQIVGQLLEDDEEFDPKDFVMRQNLHLPMSWGELKVGDVVYDPESATIGVVERPANSGPWWSDHCVFVSAYSPVYAYGNYVQHERYSPKDKLAPAYLVGRADKLGDLWQLRAKLSGGRPHPNPIRNLRYGEIGYEEGYRFAVVNNKVGDELFFRTWLEAEAEQERQRQEMERNQ